MQLKKLLSRFNNKNKQKNSEPEPIHPATTTTVIARTKVHGAHRWEQCDITEVSYLRDLHRHVFHIDARMKVNHHNRDVEFIQLSRMIRSYLHEHYFSSTMQLLYFGNKSCEMLADELLTYFKLDYCEVNEDGEGGAIVEKTQ